LSLQVRGSSGATTVFFNDTATTEIYTLSLHDALPILKEQDLKRMSMMEMLLQDKTMTKMLEARE
jgi:hypothetical protein